MVHRRTHMALSLLVTLLVVLALLPNVPAPFAVPTAQAAISTPLFKPPLYVKPLYLDYESQPVYSAALGDLNGDGTLDMLLNNGVYLNNGMGRFTLIEALLNPNLATYSMVLGDLNGDGSLDIVLGNGSFFDSNCICTLPSSSQVYLNDGQGNFPIMATLNPGGNATTSVALGDLNGDGALDILLGNDGEPSQVYLNDGQGSFPITATLNPGGNATTSVALGDLDGDDSLDIILGNGSSYDPNCTCDLPNSSQVYLNDGQGNFPITATLNPGSNNTNSVALGDLNGDGSLDILLGNRYEPSQVYLNDGQGSFPITATLNPGGNSTNSVALGDINGDGALDILLGNAGQPSQVYLNNGQGSFPITATLNPGGNATTSVAVGDLNGDGTLDILLGNASPQWSQVYLNDGQGDFTPSAAPVNSTGSSTASVALGDLNGDGALDILLGNDGEPSQVYLNNGQGSFPITATLNPGGNATTSVALGDLNGDGTLDILLGNGRNQPSQVYFNDGQGNFPITATLNPDGNATTSVALGDLNGDGTLDLILGNDNQPSQVYLNDGQGNFPITVTLYPGGNTTYSVALGDLNGDGTLDVLLGNSGQPSQIYLNNGQGGFAPYEVPFNPDGNYTNSVALGDFNGDGTLDLILSNWLEPSQVYLNDGQGNFTPTAAQLNPNFNNINPIGSVALGDLNGDGTLDLLLGNADSSQVYLNDGQGGFTPTDAPLNPAGSVALGDLNGDGMLDILLGNWNQPSQVYLNHTGTSARLPNNPPTVAVSRPGRTPDAGFYSTPDMLGSPVISIPYTLSDPEGDPVRQVRAEFSLNGGGGTWRPALPATGGLTTNLSTLPERFPGSLTTPRPIPDLGAITVPVTITTPANGTVGRVSDVEVELTISHTLVSDLRASLTAPDGTVVPLFANVGGAGAHITGLILSDHAAAGIITATAPITGTFRPTGSLATLNGKHPLGQWTLTVTDSVATNTGSLVAWALRLKTTGVQHTFLWDTFASGVFGQSDNVVVRLVALPSLSAGRNGTSLFQHPYASATTFPFRVRGTQVRVVDPLNAPMPDAIIFRLNETLAPEQQLFAPSTTAAAFTTNSSGYLRGRGELAPGDQLVALAPISLTLPYGDAYSPTVRLYATNILTTPAGISGFPVQSSGVQTVTVSPEHPLALFDLIVSLEWDATYDTRFTAQLKGDLARASELLFQATHGQAALGSVTIFQDHENWDRADIRVYASNRVRPSALIGGVTSIEFSDSAVFYGPGQVRMGAVWNRFGASSGNLSEDWPRTLVHELGHYLFFLQDNYLGLDAQGQVIPVSSCPGMMSDTYAAAWQFQTRAGWSPGCDRTFSNQATGRADWETISLFFPALRAPTAALSALPAGPIRLPLALTEIGAVEPFTPTARLAVPIFYTVDEAGGRVIPSLTARAYLFQHGHSAPDTSYTQLISLGRANSDQVLARGARVGDKLCLFEPVAARFGCETIQEGREQLTLHSRPDWHPDVQITPVTSTTLEVRVTGLPTGTGSLSVRLYPLDDDSLSALASISNDGSGIYRGTLTLPYWLPGAYLHLATADTADGTPVWETVTSYAMDGNAGVNDRAMAGGVNDRAMAGGVNDRAMAGGVNDRAMAGGTNDRAMAGLTFTRVGGAPVSSAEGDVMLVGANLTFAEGQFLLLQTTSSLPPRPAWATLIGQGYRFTTSTDWLTATEMLSGTALSFSYLDAEVPAGEEEGIQVYYRSETDQAWRPITTTLDTYFNRASIPNQGQGLYALMSSVHVSLPVAGWNLFSYPVAISREVGLALGSIAERYSIVYSHVPTDTLDPWKVYAPAPAPSWVSDLTELRFGQGYWIYATQASDLLLRGSTALTQTVDAASALSLPPATVYGVMGTVNGVAPTVGAAVEARIGATVCGRSVTRQVGDQVGFMVKVAAIGPDTPVCGAPGREVTVTVAGTTVGRAWWDNTRAVNLADTALVYMPLLRR